MLTVDPAQHPATLIVQRHAGADKVLNVGPSDRGTAGVGIQLAAPAARAAAPAAAAPRPAPLRPAAAVASQQLPRRVLGPAVPPPPPQHRVDEEELLDTMAEFANPLKKAAQPRDDEYEYDDEGSAGGSEEGSERSGDGEEEGSEYSDDDEGGGGGGGARGGGGVPAFGNFDDEPAADKPSEGYRTLEEEKSDIMFKLQRLQRQGVKGMRAFTPYSDIRDMRAELNRIRTELDLERSIKFQRKILMAIVSALEWGNGKFNPFDLELDGWSEQMHTSVSTNMEYDSIFEELWYKYKGKVSTPPEIRLLLMVGGSAMMFHMTKAMMKSALPNLMGNPDMMASMMKGMAGGGGAPGGGGGGLGGALFGGGMPGGGGQSNTAEQQQQPQNGARREMRGPGFDVSGLAGAAGGGLGGLMGGLMGGGGAGLMGGGLPGMGGVSASQLPSGLPVPPPPPSGHMKPEATRRDRAFTSASLAAGGAADDDNISDRLSDVVSDDLGSVPDDLASVRSGDSGRSGSVKNVRIAISPPGGGGRRGAKKQKVSAKKVITI